jgi:rhodanese-related sulfurtransferase/predicted transcriptional regulator
MSTSPKLALLEEFTKLSRAMGNPSRLMILEQLAQGERGVDIMADKVGLPIANCSQHLQTLRRAGLVTSRRDGKSVIYRLTDTQTLILMDTLRLVAERNLAAVELIVRGLSDGTEPPEAITRDELVLRLRDGSVTLIDVRPSDEYHLAHLPGALNIPMTALYDRLADLDLAQEIVAYCRGPYCVYAREAVAALRKHGFRARRMNGGLPEWRADGRAVSATEN